MTSPLMSPRLSPTESPAESPAQAAGARGPLESLGPRLALHLESDFGVTAVGGKVAEWASRAGWRNTVVQATDANRPTLVDNVLDGKPAVRFGGSQWLQALAQVGVVAGDYPVMYIVCSFQGSTVGYIASYDNSAGGVYRGFALERISATQIRWQTYRTAGNVFPVATTTAGGASVPALFRGSNTPSAASVDVNGVESVTQALAAGGLVSLPDNIWVGRKLDGTAPLSGDIFSIVVVTNPTPEMHAFVMDYIAAKYPSLGLPRQRPPLPASAVEYWHGELGASAASAVGQIAGTALAGINGPAVAPDPGYFNGRPVYQANATGSKVWVNAAIATPLIPAGARPYMCAVLRTRSPLTVTGNYTSISLRGGTFVPTLGELLALILEGVSGDDHYTWFRYRSTAAYVVNSPDIQDTNVHFFEMYIDATLGMLLFVDGVKYGGNAETVGLVSAIDAAAIGCLLTGAGVGTPAGITNTSLAHWMLCGSLPTTAERLALADWANKYWGAPKPGPATILGSLLHADFDVADPGVVLNAGGVASIPNRGGDTAAMVQATAANQPVYGATSFAGGPGASFDGVDDRLLCTLATPLAIGRRPYMWVVFQSLSTAIADRIDVSIFGGGGYMTARHGTAGNANFAAQLAPGLSAPSLQHLGPPTDLNPHLVEVGFTVGGIKAAAMDGTTVNMTAAASIPLEVVFNQMSLGTYGNAPAYCANCVIRRFIVANDMPSDAQIAAMRAYLRAQPYGLTF